MKEFTYFMPTKIVFGKDCIINNSNIFKNTGTKAMIVTGRNSAKINGSEKDVIFALEKENIEYIIFDEVEENPDVEIVVKAAEIGKKEKVDFVIGIGGGSPMDAAKAISCLVANPDCTEEILLEEQKKHIPVIEIPTTAGTGSEATPLSVLTFHKQKTKSSINQRIFAECAFLDAKYTESLSPKITNNTAIDALSHIIEGYMAVKSNFFSDIIAEAALKIFKECIPYIENKEYDFEIREKLLICSTIAGILIAQTGTSLPHFFGYQLTYNKHIAHGAANGMLMTEYLKLFGEDEKVLNILNILGMENIEQLQKFFKTTLKEYYDIKFTDEEIDMYTDNTYLKKEKLSTFPYSISKEDIKKVYIASLM